MFAIAIAIAIAIPPGKATVDALAELFASAPRDSDVATAKSRHNSTRPPRNLPQSNRVLPG